MGALGKLSQFSGIQPESTPNEPIAEPKNTTPPEPTGKTPPEPSPQEKLTTVNIKIRKSQKHWLTEVASQVRENNKEAVAPADRVYPQHLIGVAIELLQASDVDWSQVRNIEELRQHLNL
nr:hypothetical protein [Oscillatoria laete-virens]